VTASGSEQAGGRHVRTADPDGLAVVRSRPPLPRLVWTVLRDLAVGTPGEPEWAHPRGPRAGRSTTVHATVDATGIRWRSTILRRPGFLPAHEIGTVCLVDVEYASTTASFVLGYLVILDHDQVPRLRVLNTAPGGSRVPEERRWRALLPSTLGLSVVRATPSMARPKDLRHRWPEAFSFVHAYPITIAFAAIGAWIALAALLDLVL
jgi:hypothetical protein